MNEQKKIIHVLIAFCIIFFILVGYMTYLQIFKSAKLTLNPLNRRQQELENTTVRGNIFDKNGVLLAKTDKTKGNLVRVYPFRHLYSQVIGYNSKVYGRSLLEASYNNYLLGTDEYSKVFNIINKFKTDQRIGNSLYLTLDHKIQSLGEKLIGNKLGAVVAMNPKTGEIIALISKPDYNPNEKDLVNTWHDLVESRNHSLLPRATQGLYVPGSTFKIVTSALGIENELADLKIQDKGTVTIDGKQIRNENSKAYGNIDMTKALSVSSNVFYSQLGVKLGGGSLKEMVDRIGIGNETTFDIPITKSIFPYKEDMGKTDMAAIAMGQGKMMITPMQMALITSCIANGGIMMKPILVSRITNSNGKVIKSIKSSSLYNVMQMDIADKVKAMMQSVVENGTGKNAAIKGIHVAGKTGTAENELSIKQKNKAHAWFIGFAPVEDPQIAVAVVIEYGGGSGGTLAAPIARKIMSEYLKIQK
jgi:penicillin-binding protein A